MQKYKDKKVSEDENSYSKLIEKNYKHPDIQQYYYDSKDGENWDLELLENYARVFAKGNKYYYVIFSLGGFTEELMSVAEERNVMLSTLDDLYRD